MKKVLKIKAFEIEIGLEQDFMVFSEMRLEPGNIIRIGGCIHKILEVKEFTSMDEMVDFVKIRAQESMHDLKWRNQVDWGMMRTARIVKSEEEIENTIGYADVLEFEQH